MDQRIATQVQKALNTSNVYQPPSQWRAWLAQIVLGLEHLHLTVRMLVRDIKPQNVVHSADGLVAKLADFGMSKMTEASTGRFSFAPRMPPGSPHFVAPEVLLGNGYDRRADYYSLGVLTWVLSTGGLKSYAPEPVPPCADFKDIEDLATNWKLLKECVDDPANTDARPVPDDILREFILTLTDRSPAHNEIDHEWIHAHPLFQGVNLPARGSGVADVELWLKTLQNNKA